MLLSLLALGVALFGASPALAQSQQPPVVPGFTDNSQDNDTQTTVINANQSLYQTGTNNQAFQSQIISVTNVGGDMIAPPPIVPLPPPPPENGAAPTPVSAPGPAPVVPDTIINTEDNDTQYTAIEADQSLYQEGSGNSATQTQAISSTNVGGDQVLPPIVPVPPPPPPAG